MSDEVLEFRLIPMRKVKVTITTQFTKVFWTDKPKEALESLKKLPDDLLADSVPKFKLQDVTGDPSAIPSGMFNGCWWSEEEINEGVWTDDDHVSMKPYSVMDEMAKLEAAGQRRIPFPVRLPFPG